MDDKLASLCEEVRSFKKSKVTCDTAILALVCIAQCASPQRASPQHASPSVHRPSVHRPSVHRPSMHRPVCIAPVCIAPAYIAQCASPQCASPQRASPSVHHPSVHRPSVHRPVCIADSNKLAKQRERLHVVSVVADVTQQFLSLNCIDENLALYHEQVL